MKFIAPNILLVLCIFGSVHYAIAQSPAAVTTRPGNSKVNLTGKITNGKTGEPLAGASVYFPDLRAGTTTNEQGIYRFQNISQGKHLLEISFLGYASIVEPIILAGNIQKDFSLNPSYVENEAVTVTGVSSATSVKRTPVPVSIIKKEDFFRGVSTNLIDALSKTPGVSQISTGPAVSKPSIRGLGYNRVVVVNDGIRQEGQQWGDEHGIEIDEYNVTKAEILKGPASLMYGSDALAGVMNIISILPVEKEQLKEMYLAYTRAITNSGVCMQISAAIRTASFGVHTAHTRRQQITRINTMAMYSIQNLMRRILVGILA
jgi:iron complex outermembrane receptor protein